MGTSGLSLGPVQKLTSATALSYQPSSPNRLSASEAVLRMAQKRLKARDLVEACLDRIDAREGQVHAWEALDPEGARKRADMLDKRSRPAGPLHGIPWGGKDLLDTAGIPTTYGAEPYRNRIPAEDAVVVKRLHQAGAVLVAKLSLGVGSGKAQWFRLTAFDDVATECEALRVGAFVQVQGRLNASGDQVDGDPRYTVAVIVDRIRLIARVRGFLYRIILLVTAPTTKNRKNITSLLRINTARR